VPTDVQTLVAETEAKLAADQSVFTGPIAGQDGTVVIPAGTTLDAAAVDAMDYFVEGIIGEIPQG